MELDRRNFLRVAGATAAVAGATMAGAGGAMASQAPADSSKADAAAPAGPAPAGGNASASSELDTDWRTAPAEVTDFADEYDADVVVVGHGFAGTTCYRWIAEQGHKVILLEAQEQDSWSAVGNEFASLNSDILQQRGVEHIDPVDFFNNFMKITGNVPNPTLVMKFAQNSADATNWYLSECTDDDLATMTTSFFPKTDHQLSELNGIKFWGSVCSFYGDCNQTKLLTYNAQVAQDNGGQLMWGTTGKYIIMKDGAVAGIVAQNADGYIKVNCKAVVVACGSFGGNTAMMNELMPDMYNALVEGESLGAMMGGRDGSGVKMAYWAGAHLETTPVAGMNMKGLAVPGKMNVLPQALWVDENGKRFCNEFYPVAEQRGYQDIFKTRKKKYAIVDDNFTTYRQYTLPQHAGFDATEANIQSLRDSLDEAYAKFNGTYVESAAADAAPAGAPMSSNNFIADDTLEGLADQLGFDEQAKANFLAQVEQYNQYCDDGVDQQFGRSPEVLFPVSKAPFYAVEFDPVLGETMVACGGLITDGEQNCLDKNYEPIPGLYASGNDCGRRFGYEYVTPIPGCSLGFAITLGRECGKSVCAFLEK